MSAEILNAQHNDDTFENIWQELKWRGLVHVSTDEGCSGEGAERGEPDFLHGL